MPPPTRPPVRPSPTSRASRPGLVASYPARALNRSPAAAYASLAREQGFRRYQVALVPGQLTPNTEVEARAISRTLFSQINDIGWGRSPDRDVLRIVLSCECSANGVRTSEPSLPVKFSAQTPISKVLYDAYVQGFADEIQKVSYPGLVVCPGSVAMFTEAMADGRNAAFNRAMVMQSQCENVVFVNKASTSNIDGWDESKFNPSVVSLQGPDLKDYIVPIVHPDGSLLFASLFTCFDIKLMSALAEPFRALVFCFNPSAGSPFEPATYKPGSPVVITADGVNNPLIPADVSVPPDFQGPGAQGMTGTWVATNVPDGVPALTYRWFTGWGFPESMVAGAMTFLGLDQRSLERMTTRYQAAEGLYTWSDGARIFVTPPLDLPVVDAKDFEALAARISGGGSIVESALARAAQSNSEGDPAGPHAGGGASEPSGGASEPDEPEEPDEPAGPDGPDR